MAAEIEFEIGASVECEDGPCGVLGRVVVDPIKRAVTHLVVEPRHQHALARLVPIELAESAEGAIRLSCTVAQWRALQYVEEAEFLPYSGNISGQGPESGLAWPYFALAAPRATPLVHDRVPPGEFEIRRGEHVNATDGPIGRVEGVAVDPTDHHLTHVLLQEGHVWGQRDVAIPVGAVARIDSDGVHVTLSKQQIEELPPVPLQRPG